MHFPRRKFLVAALIIIAVLVPLWPAFEEPASPMDEGSLLIYPELILKGHVPYRDFETFYGPANLFVLSGVYAATGPNIFVERAVGLLYRILILTAFFALMQRWNTTIAAGGAFLAGFLMLSNGLPAYAWIGAVMCALWSLWMIFRADSARRCFWGGTFAGLALLFRPDLAPAVAASGLPLFLLMQPARRWNYLGGVTLALLPLVWLTILAGPWQIINNLLLFPVFYCSPGRRLPIFLGQTYLICLFSLHVIALATNVLAGIVSVRSAGREPSSRLLLGLGLLGLGLTHQAAQRFDFGHVVSAAVLSISVLPLSILVLQSYWRGVTVQQSDALLATAIVLVLLQGVAPELTRIARDKIIAGLGGTTPTSIFVEHRDRSFPVKSMREALSLDKTLNQLDEWASSGDRLFVGPADLRRTNYNDNFIYHMMPQLRPVSYFLEMNPHSANRPNSRLAADIADADWLVLNHHWDGWNEPNDSVNFGSDAPMRIVQNNFELCGQYSDYDLYRRRTSAALTRWSCNW
jgi:hypothetical protein